MGLLGAIKKRFKGDGNAEASPLHTEKIGEGTSDTAIGPKDSEHIPPMTPATNALVPATGHEIVGTEVMRTSLTTSFHPEGVPPEVLRLLWFKDGPLCNYHQESELQESLEVGGFTFRISFFGASEPSAIGIGDPIRSPGSPETIDRPPYFPSYGGLSPEQRWTYLRWLTDVDAEIDIGYVFIFYYGLERHLFFGDYEAAFDMILRLRRVHKNGSFTGYSASALIAASLMRHRPDLFVAFLKSLDEIKDQDVNSLYLLAKRALGVDLDPSEIMLLAQEVGFTNRRYLDGEKALFRSELESLMLKTHGKHTLSLNPFSLAECPVRPVIIIANYSIRQEQRTVPVPDLSQNIGFGGTVHSLLQETHEVVKLRLKELRKEKAASQPGQSGEKVGQYTLIPCPYCGALTRTPSGKGLCQICKKTIRARIDPDTKQKVFVTEDDARRFDARKKDLQVIRFAVKSMWPFGMTAEQTERTYQELKEKKDCTVNDAVWKLVNDRMETWTREGTIPSQYCYLAMANLLEFEGKDKGGMMARFEEEDKRAREREMEQRRAQMLGRT